MKPPPEEPTRPAAMTLDPADSLHTIRPPSPSWPTLSGGSTERYTLESVLGVGGMGIVYRAHDHLLGCTCALKALSPELAPRKDLVARFVAEARATARLEHPGVVPVHDMGQLPDGRHFYTMREIRAGTLAEVIHEAHRKGPPTGATLRRLVDALRRVAETVAYAHAQGVVHRDLKPINVSIGPFGEVLVLDWGLVLLLQAERVESGFTDLARLRALDTEVRGVAGTPHYLAPEQARGDVDAIDARTDTWALGAILHEVLEGRPPYPDCVGNAAVAAARVGPPAPPRGPAGLVAICVHAMAFAPADRHVSALDFAADLDRWLDGDSRREEALALVQASEAFEQEESNFRIRAAQSRAQTVSLAVALAATPSGARRGALWAAEDAAAAADRAAALSEANRLQHLQGALSRDAELPEALDALASYHAVKLRTARLHRDGDAVIMHTHFLRTYDRGRYTRYAEGISSFTLVTDPPDAAVQVRAVVEENRQLVAGAVQLSATTPLHAHDLPAGSYIAELRHPNRAPVDLPVWLDPDTAFTTVAPAGTAPVPIRLPHPRALGSGDVYVPPGWARLGPYGAPGGTLPDRVWVEGFVIRRDPVTHGEFLAFLNDLVARGLDEDACRYAPAERASRPEEVGRPCYQRAADGTFQLAPDAEGDIWSPRWPVFLIDWFAARAYARWEADRTGQAWQLPKETWWEKAARGVDGRLYPWGDRPEGSFACVRGWRPGRMLPVNVDQIGDDVSVYGVRGMAGNVRDWCVDPANPNVATENDPLTERVVKGGAFFFNLLPASTRLTLNAGNRGDTIGFRIARPFR